MDRVSGEEKGNAEDAHGWSVDGWRDIDMVDELPLAVVLDGTLSISEKVHV